MSTFAIANYNESMPTEMLAVDSKPEQLTTVLDSTVLPKVLKLMSIIDNLPGSGSVTIVTTDEAKSEHNLPASDFIGRSLLQARLGNAMMTAGGAAFRLHTPHGKDYLYGAALGSCGWRGCSSEEVRQSYLICSCCGEASGYLLDHEVCCDWPSIEG